ncbi:hypothetical protein FB561_6749 [Kribbella amoyensis]|uniref:Uncharacterized protein n=1 Tax=Kribbella amoyensis TaxID=996641 RepID=A0A561B8M4_9ACTN|nr:hypothetical protein [Kribbella amoyensis]TWD75311.1 hypothetical protein FB561_6749 [Kribbella amoyensis]
MGEFGDDLRRVFRLPWVLGGLVLVGILCAVEAPDFRPGEPFRRQLEMGFPGQGYFLMLVALTLGVCVSAPKLPLGVKPSAHPWRTVVAKLGTSAVVTVAVVVPTLVATAVAAAILAGNGAKPAVTTTGELLAMGGGIVVLTVVASWLGVLISLIFWRYTIVVVFLVWFGAAVELMTVWEPERTGGSTMNHIGQWLPAINVYAVLDNGTQYAIHTEDPGAGRNLGYVDLSFAHGLTYLAVGVAVLAVLGLALGRYRLAVSQKGEPSRKL